MVSKRIFEQFGKKKLTEKFRMSYNKCMANLTPKAPLMTIDKAKVRRHFDKETYQWYFSITDIIGMVTESSDARNYWKVLKNRLNKTQKELVTRCNQAKMPASDGKMYFTDVADTKTMLEIIEIVSPINVKIFSDWFIQIEQEEDPATTKNKVVSLQYQSEKSTGGSSVSGNFNKIVTKGISNDEEENDSEGELLADMWQENDFIFVKTMTAGVDPENLFVSIKSTSMFIKGKRAKIGNINDEDYLHNELYFGAFTRTIDFPTEVDIDNVIATESHGLVTFKIKKLDKSRSKIIKVKSL
jgi:HSP20 family molecular chaperone IbpA